MPSCRFFSLKFALAKSLFPSIHKAKGFHFGQPGFCNDLSRNSKINPDFPNRDRYGGELLYLTDNQERTWTLSYLVVESIKKFVISVPQPMAFGPHIEVLE